MLFYSNGAKGGCDEPLQPPFLKASKETRSFKDVMSCPSFILKKVSRGLYFVIKRG